MYLNIREVALRYRVGTLTIRALATQGKFPAPLRVGKQLRWSLASLEQWEAAQRAPAADHHHTAEAVQ